MTEGGPDPASAAAVEALLVRHALGGDPEAYGGLVAMHQSAAFRVAYVLLGDAAEAEDAAQEGFVKAYLALRRFRVGEPFRPWLLRIVGNAARNRRRARSRRDGVLDRAIAAVRGTSSRSGRQAGVDPSGDTSPVAGPVSPSPEVVALAGETQREIRAALLGLREEERLVVTCRYLLDLTEAETASALAIPAGTVKSRLHRALRRLRDELGAPDALAEASR